MSKKAKSIHKLINLNISEFYSVAEKILEHVYSYIKTLLNLKTKIKDLKTENVRSRLVNFEILKKTYNKDDLWVFYESVIKIKHTLLTQ